MPVCRSYDACRVSEALWSERSVKQTDPDWDRMLRRLRRSYKELLDQSLHGIAWMELGLSTRPDMVRNVTNLLFRLPHRGERLLAPGTSIVNAYDEAEGELLILGAPGAGKSTLLLDLALQLIDRALSDALYPLPVILQLSSWAIQRLTLADWVIEQLSQAYDVPHQLSEHWVIQGHVLPLLDGLDEEEAVARPVCIEAINHYHRTHLLPLVVCSRQADYEVAAKRERLALQSAIIIQSLSSEQIEGYLSTVGPSFAGMHAALRQRKALWELATTPLMFSVLLLTYRDASMNDIMEQETDLEWRVWTDYVARQVQEKGNETQYSLQRTHHWLSWLAQQMQAHQQTTFYAEYLSIGWLSNTQQRLASRLTTLISSMVIGICASLLVSLIVGFGGISLLQVGTFGGFVGGCLSPSVVERPAETGRRPKGRTVRRLRNAALLGILIAASVGIFLGSRYGLRNWLLDGCTLGLGSMLSGWAFQVLFDRMPKQQAPVSHKRLNLRDHLAVWVNTMIPLHVWQAAGTFGIGIGLSYGLNSGLRIMLRDGPHYGLSYVIQMR